MNNTFTFEKIFLGRMFRIPDYQRGYAWEKRHWNDLIEDLELLPLGRTHYTGTLVVRHAGESKFRDENGQSYEIFDVIDGQQRLTTVVLFLDAIHDEMNRLGQTRLAEGLKRMYLTVLDRNEQPHTKLSLNRDCQEFFYNNVLGFAPTVGGPVIRSHQKLLGAHQRIEEYLAEQRTQQGETYPDWLNELYEKVTQGLTVLLYEVESEMDAGVIFETMNDRGKELTDLEKVKNHLLYLASKLDLDDPHDLGQRINQAWNRIFEELMASGLGDDENESQLLRVHWLMTVDATPQNWLRYTSIKERFNLRKYHGRHPQLLEDLKDYLKSLADAATAYCDIHDPRRAGAFNDIADASSRAQIVAASEKLVRLGTRTTFLPLLIAVRLKAKDGGITYLQAVQMCENFDFRVYQWIRARASAAQSAFFRLGRQFYENPASERLVASISRLVLDYCPDVRFIERFQRETEDWYHWQGLKYFLYEYELHLAVETREPVRMQWSDLWDTKRDTIEHILPQTPTRDWREAFPEKARRQRWTHDIGNLTLTYDNSSLQNKSFLDKRGAPAKPACYASSSFFIERQLAGYSHWTEAEIIQRREQIQQWAVTRWHVEAPTTSDRVETTDLADNVMRLADEGNVAQEYQALLDFAVKHQLYLHPWANSMMIAPISRRTVALCTIWPQNGYLDVGVWFTNIEKYLHVPMDKLKSIFSTGDDKVRAVVVSTNLGDFLAQLEQAIPGVSSPVADTERTTP